MNIVVLNKNAGNEKYGEDLQTAYLARELVRLGHDVTVITATYSDTRSRNPMIKNNFFEEMCDGVRFVFIKTFRYKNEFQRHLSDLEFMLKVRCAHRYIQKKYAPDVVVSASQYPIDMKAAIKIANIQGGNETKLCFQLSTFCETDTLQKNKENSSFATSYRKEEVFSIEHADVIVSPYSEAHLHLAELGYHYTNFHCVPMGVLTESVGAKADNDIINQIIELRVQGKLVILCSGPIQQNRIQNLVAASKLLDDTFSIILSGKCALSGEEKEQMLKDAHGKICILPPIPPSELSTTLKYADILYLEAKADPYNRYGILGCEQQLYDDMLAGVPIVFVTPLSENIIEKTGCGITVTSGESSEIAEAFYSLKNMPQDQLWDIGQKGKRYAILYHDYRRIAEKIENILSPYESENGGNDSDFN